VEVAVAKAAPSSQMVEVAVVVVHVQSRPSL
jgi:hypothetical protein